MCSTSCSKILDEGCLTDGKGRRVSFVNTLVVLTSNLGAKRLTEREHNIGFANQGGTRNQHQAVLEEARSQLAPELWGRLDERLVFDRLTRSQVKEVAELMLKESSKILFAEREITMKWSDELLEFLLEHGGFSPETGARGMRQTIQRYVEGPLAEQILRGEVTPGDHATLRPHPSNAVVVERMAFSA